ncbi:MAG: nitrate reductase cytochrome c-type subunit [Acidiferrobacterales bacterium]
MKQVVLFGVLALTAAWAWAQGDNIATLRGAPIEAEPEATRMPQVENKDIKRRRNYPMQPPTIPHKIDAYQVDLNTNKCMSCHSRRRTEESQAPMVSVTHYMNREGQFLAEVSPRRYFCTQCHIIQTDARPPIENTFEDVDDILARKRKTQKK